LEDTRAEELLYLWDLGELIHHSCRDEQLAAGDSAAPESNLKESVTQSLSARDLCINELDVGIAAQLATCDLAKLRWIGAVASEKSI
jgi:hypothetical protein